ncbi:cytochrome P450 [Rhizorhabdus wittichii]|jgi:cytochrome P450|uniref:cytochrome P450 n=1 Tax=Rhizorhabdus wittichii TaxID=160791 RepID=UPI00031B05D8|nr:cytochrome P450 [Rhizorhabdus wittichii]
MSYQEHQAAQRLETIPPHVPADRVVDLDYFSPPGVAEDPHLAWKRLHDGPDIIYTPYYGGHWIVTRADDMFAVMQDYETFSNWEFTVPKRGPGNPVLMPNQLDPPRHGPIRSVVLRPMSPKAVEPIEPVIRKIMADRIASIVPKGGCEFVGEFGGDIPPELFFEHARIPKDKLPEMKRFADAVARSDNEEDRRAARIGGANYMMAILDERRQVEELDDDVFSVIVRAEREGRITREESTSIALNVFFGGLETVSSALAFIVLFLARHPEHRRQLIEDASLTQDATEEFLRRFGILNLARIATRSTTFKGLTIEQGEQVLLPLHLAGLDERKFPNPLEVDFHRKRAGHFNFGTGPHRCLGSNLARPEIRIFIEEWLRQIPDFSVDPDDKPVGASGVAMTMTRVPLVWPSR